MDAVHFVTFGPPILTISVKPSSSQWRLNRYRHDRHQGQRIRSPGPARRLRPRDPDSASAATDRCFDAPSRSVLLDELLWRSRAISLTVCLHGGLGRPPSYGSGVVPKFSRGD